MRHRFALCLCAHSPVPPLLFCAQMPDHVLKVLQALPKGTHPMTQFAQGILALQAGSKFREAYDRGVHKSQ